MQYILYDYYGPMTEDGYESFMKIGKAYGCFSIDIYDDNGELIQGDDYYYEERGIINAKINI